MRLKLERMGPTLALGGIGAMLGAALGALMGGPEVGYTGTVIGAFGGAISGLVTASWFRRQTIAATTDDERCDR
jgi:uncharacterized membrane protein